MVIKEGFTLRRLYPKRPLVGVGAVLVCNGKILLVKRSGKPGRGKWSIPGGLVELGERVEQTLMREVEEECSLKIENPKLIDVVNSITLDEEGKIKYHFIIVDYFAKIKGGKLKAAEDAAEVRWVPLREVEKYDLTKTFREFFERHREELERFNSCL